MIELKIKRNVQGTPLYIWQKEKDLKSLELSAAQVAYLVAQAKESKVSYKTLWHEDQHVYFLHATQKSEKEEWQIAESYRKLGANLYKELNAEKIETLYIHSLNDKDLNSIRLAEGIILRAYQFLKYRSDAKDIATSLKHIYFSNDTVLPTQVKQLEVSMGAVYQARDLVNEPLSYLTSEQLSEEIKRIGKESGFKVSVFGKGKIEQLGMGGILGVNRGSQNPPTFNIMEYFPINAKNKEPIVLVGKGVVYDTGGVSLKPTLNSMDRMKSDMSGAALVIATMKAIAELELPVHVVALVPSTDNRPGENAYVPGDVLKMYGGKTVEVLNTDAEGRLILADALVYAQKYKPSLVIDFATLTGAASVAVGDIAMVNMGTDKKAMEAFEDAGFRQFEKIVSYPLWEEYSDLIKSDIADLKNVGGPRGGAITAGAFLKEFTDYPWVHFDIAGVSHTTATKDYRTEGGTGYGVRMLLDYFITKFK